MSNLSDVQGDHNVVIQGISESSITVNVNGEIHTIQRELQELKNVLQQLHAQIFVSAGKTFGVDSLNAGNFDFILEQSRVDKALPSALQEHLITDRNRWVQSLRQELQKQKVPVSSNPSEVINYYGWLIEIYLQKMLTRPGQAGDLRALSFMTEAWYSSLRYLCYIQLAQILKNDEGQKAQNIQAYIALNGDPEEDYLTEECQFDYLGLLMMLHEVEQVDFVPEMTELVNKLLDTKSDLYATSLFLERQRQRLLSNQILEAELATLIPEYLTGLTYWLRQIAFLARYRLVSIKDINLSYRLGTAKNFIHLYGELHGMYHEAFAQEDDYNLYEVEEFFTYNQSVLLFKGTDVASCLNQLHDAQNYLSLSPLVIDQSVFADKKTQTPEIFYYIGRSNKGRKYHFAQYKNELPIKGKKGLLSNKTLTVAAENNQQPRLNELFSQLDIVFHPFITPAS